MNLIKLFEMQKVLDDRIIEEHGLRGKNLLPNTVLALQVEIGELANEWRGFKIWSKDREPRREKMLVEYVDCLHFILSIGLHLKGHEITVINDLIKEFLGPLEVFQHLFNLCVNIQFMEENGRSWNTHYNHLLGVFIALGTMLGFTWEQIEAAYMDKNSVNHERQTNGY